MCCTDAGIAALNKDLKREINECYLFHGTDGESKDGIINKGVDSRLSSGLFGQGSYFAESSTKSDQYAGRRHLILFLNGTV